MPSTSWLSAQLSSFLFATLRRGPIPSHVAFIMDGNRRFARRAHLPSTMHGHHAGFATLQTILEVCLRLGVKCVSVYAFSVENFKRSRGEVEALMALAKDKLELLCDRSDLMKEYDVRIRVIGDLDLLPADVRVVVDRVIRLTADNTRDEIRQAVNRIESAALANQISICDIDIATFDSHMLTFPGPPLDLLVRTSGEVRLSDFMLWQATRPGCLIRFLDVCWPELSRWDMVKLVVEYQIEYARLQRDRADDAGRRQQSGAAQ